MAISLPILISVFRFNSDALLPVMGLLIGVMRGSTVSSANVADKAYGSAALRQSIADAGAIAVIPSKSNARVPSPHDPELYAMRTLVERVHPCS